MLASLRQRDLVLAGADAHRRDRDAGGDALDALLLGGEQLLDAGRGALADEDDARAAQRAVDHGGRVDVAGTGDVGGDGLAVGVPATTDRGEGGPGGAGLPLDLAVGGPLGAAAHDDRRGEDAEEHAEDAEDPRQLRRGSR